MSATWRVEQDPADELFNLLRDGVLLAYPLGDEQEVAEVLEQESAENDDTLIDQEGDDWTVAEYIHAHL